MTWPKNDDRTGRRVGRHPRGVALSNLRLRVEPRDLLMIHDAARICGLSAASWSVRELRFSAERMRLATANVPQALRPNAKVFRVKRAPVQGAWEYRQILEALGTERCYVFKFVEDAPPGISPSGKACVFDIIPNGPRAVIADSSDIRWVGATPIDEHHWTALSARYGEEEDAADSGLTPATDSRREPAASVQSSEPTATADGNPAS